MTRAAIYARISQSDPQVDAIADQIKRCRELAAREGYEVVSEFSDDGISGWSGKARPGFLELNDALRLDRFDVIVAVAEDRFTRSAEEKLGFQAACARVGVTWHTISGGKVDPSTKEGRLFGTITGGIAEYESALRSDRVAASVQRRLAEGKDLGGRRAFGFEGRKTPTIHEGEAALIRDAHQAILDGATIYHLARLWDQSPFKPTGKAERWRTQTIRNILLRPRNAGRLVVKGVDYGAHLPAIVSQEEHEAVVAILTNPARAPKRGPKARKWTAGGGTVTCSVCGSRVDLTTNRGVASFRCAREGRLVEGRHPGMQAEPLERQIAEATLARVLAMAESGDSFTVDNSEAAALRLEVAELVRQRDVQQELATWPGANLGAAKAEIGRLGDAIATKQADLDRALASDAGGGALALAADFVADMGGWSLVRGTAALEPWAAFWEGLAVAQRQQLVGAVFESLELLPASRTTHWRLRIDGKDAPEPEAPDPSEAF